MIPLTRRQTEVLDYICSSSRENGYQPSYTEIAAHFGWKSNHSVTCHVASLKKKGAIEVIGPRAIRDLRGK